MSDPESIPDYDGNPIKVGCRVVLAEEAVRAKRTSSFWRGDAKIVDKIVGKSVVVIGGGKWHIPVHPGRNLRVVG